MTKSKIGSAKKLLAGSVPPGEVAKDPGVSVPTLCRRVPASEPLDCFRMINTGSKGQYIRRASNRLLWDGIPEIEETSRDTATAGFAPDLLRALRDLRGAVIWRRLWSDLPGFHHEEHEGYEEH